MYENKRLPNMAVLINDTNYEKRGYGYGYGQPESKKIMVENNNSGLIILNLAIIMHRLN